jgi:hypothetical protein
VFVKLRRMMAQFPGRTESHCTNLLSGPHGVPDIVTVVAEVLPHVNVVPSLAVAVMTVEGATVPLAAAALKQLCPALLVGKHTVVGRLGAMDGADPQPPKSSALSCAFTGLRVRVQPSTGVFVVRSAA